MHLVVLDERLLPSHSITGEGWGLKKPPLLALSSQHPICIQSVKGPAHKMSDPVLTSSTAQGRESERQSLCGTTQQPAQLWDRTVSQPVTPAGQRQRQSAFQRESRPPTQPWEGLILKDMTPYLRFPTEGPMALPRAKS